jgi:hypothetical protein
MDPKLLAQVMAALNTWFASMAASLTDNARTSYAEGAKAADREVRIRLGSSAYSEAAANYAKEYGRKLVEDGGSEVFDKEAGKYVFKPWYSDSSEETRSRVVEIIEQGIKDGKPAGTKERKKGGYTDGSIAKDLEEYFDERRSHASTVAHTEKANITNASRLEQLQRRGVREVDVYDGTDDDDECRAANGSRWPIEYALEHRLQHPNCTRRFRAVLDGATIRRG